MSEESKWVVIGYLTNGWITRDGHWNSEQHENESELLRAIRFQYLENNFACDCNRSRLSGRGEMECGNSLKFKLLKAISPQGREVIVFDELKDGAE